MEGQYVLQRINGLLTRLGYGLGQLMLRLAKLSALAVTIGSLLIVLDALLFPEEDDA